LDQAVAALRAALGENLYSCCVYGSAVRGNLIEGLSDINLLILLEDSTPAAHRAIASAIGGDRQIDPFVLARRGFARSVRAFATKFASIRRNYRVLHGADPLAGVQADPPLERFLCEQAVRNLRLRLVYAFVTRQVNKAYDRFLVRSVTPLFTQFGEVLRLHGLAVPKDFQERIGTLEKQLGLDAAVLRDLLALKAKPEKFSDAQAVNWHERVFPQVDKVLVWIETHWPAQQV
jgi:hypothetical protein